MLRIAFRKSRLDITPFANCLQRRKGTPRRSRHAIQGKSFVRGLLSRLTRTFIPVSDDDPYILIDGNVTFSQTIYADALMSIAPPAEFLLSFDPVFPLGHILVALNFLIIGANALLPTSLSSTTICASSTPLLTILHGNKGVPNNPLPIQPSQKSIIWSCFLIRRPPSAKSSTTHGSVDNIHGCNSMIRTALLPAFVHLGYPRTDGRDCLCVFANHAISLPDTMVDGRFPPSQRR
jgi:hypothetical protein